MKVIVATSRGFCFGVEDAIKMAQDAIERYGSGNVVALGAVIHNDQVTRRLESAGLGHTDDLEAVGESGTVLVGSHGAPPETFATAAERGLHVVDATCVLVKQAQEAVHRLHEDGYHVVMIGDPNHAEVKGVIGYAPVVTVIDHKTDLEQALPFRDRIGIVAQTTHAPAYVAGVIARILERPYREVKVINTLCLEVTRRQVAAVALAQEVEVVFVLGGSHSANTRELVRLCRAQGCDTHHLATWEQFERGMVAGKSVAGVTAGASTPDWIIDEFVQALEAV